MIKGLSEIRRLPRAGKIKLGVMVEANGKTYPRSCDYFVCPQEVQAVFGNKPKELSIAFPLDNTEKIFEQSLKMYKSGGGLFCSGNGEKAYRWSPEGKLLERACPCEYLEGDRPQCKPTATLRFILPDVKVLGVWDMVVHGRAAIIGLNSALDHFGATFGGLRGIPFTLKMTQVETQRHDEKRREMVKTIINVPALTAYMSYGEILRSRHALGAKVDQLMLPVAVSDQEEYVEEEPDVEVVTIPVKGLPTEQPSVAASTPASVGHSSAAEQALYKGQVAGSNPAAPTKITESWTIEALYRAATGFGVSPQEYTAYLRSVYKTDALSSSQIQEQGDNFERAEASGPATRELAAKTIRLKAKK